MTVGRPKKQKPDIKVNERCVFALCNQFGKMRDMIGKQKYCMIINNYNFESTQFLMPESDDVASTKMWADYGYEDVCKVKPHTCESCRFFKDVREYKLVPTTNKVRYSWVVERREQN